MKFMQHNINSEISSSYGNTILYAAGIGLIASLLGIYAFGGKYRNNARVLLGVVAGGLVIGAVNKNIEVDKQIEKTKGNLPFLGYNDAKSVQKEREIVKKSQNQSFTGFNEETYWNDAFNQYNSYTPTDNAKK